ncbi:MAG: hypothetical protein ACE15D_09615 [Candidatus Eisenbacteria bacterium]
MLHTIRIRTRAAGAAFAAVLLFLPVSAVLAEDGPGGLIQAGSDAANDPVDAIQAPAAGTFDMLLPDLSGFAPDGALNRHEVPGAGPEDRSDTVTDAGYGLPPAAPNALERTKLEMARAAVEASRRAGTLETRGGAEDGTLVTTEEQEAIKLQRLEALAPATITEDPAAGLLPFEPVQVQGPPTLNEIEQAKLRGEPLPSAPQADPDEAAPASVTPVESDAPAAQEEK